MNKRIILGIFSVFFIVSLNMNALAEWQQDSVGYKWIDANGNYVINSGEFIDSDSDGVAQCYYFDANGYMITDAKAPYGSYFNSDGMRISSSGEIDIRITTGQVTADTSDIDYIWSKDKNGKWYITNRVTNTIQSDTWFCDDVDKTGKKWYLLDRDGRIVYKGLIRDKANNYFSIETDENGIYGAVRSKSGVYEGINIIINEIDDNLPPTINNQEAIDALASKYGVLELDELARTDIIYASSLGRPEKMIKMRGFYADEEQNRQKEWIKLSGEEEQIIEEFKKKYIKSEMTDFEKEMTILKWMSNHITYDYDNYNNNTVPPESNTTYGALVKRVAVCGGYAKTFKAIAERCGLNVLIVTGESGAPGKTEKKWEAHAWNQIKLDDSWYNVDPTCVDDDKQGQLNIYYINAADSYFQGTHAWNRERFYACGNQYYGRESVKRYFDNNESITKEEMDSIKIKEMDAFKKFHTNQFGFCFLFSDIDTTSEEIFNYLCQIIDRKEKEYKFTVNFPQFNINQKDGYSNVFVSIYQLNDKIMEKLKNKYGADEIRKSHIGLDMHDDNYVAPDGTYYGHIHSFYSLVK